jgi:hypothetical protein
MCRKWITEVVSAEQLQAAAFRESPAGIVKLSEVGAVANHISLMRHI